jgi:MFS family permease
MDWLSTVRSHFHARLHNWETTRHGLLQASPRDRFSLPCFMCPPHCAMYRVLAIFVVPGDRMRGTFSYCPIPPTTYQAYTACIRFHFSAYFGPSFTMVYVSSLHVYTSSDHSLVHKRRALAFGIIACGTSLGGIVFPIMARFLLPAVGFPWTARILAFVIAAALTFGFFVSSQTYDE